MKHKIIVWALNVTILFLAELQRAIETSPFDLRRK